MPNPDSEAAEVLQRLLALIDDGEISADTPLERGMVRRVEGAIAAFEAVARSQRSRADEEPEA